MIQEGDDCNRFIKVDYFSAELARRGLQQKKWELSQVCRDRGDPSVTLAVKEFGIYCTQDEIPCTRSLLHVYGKIRSLETYKDDGNELCLRPNAGCVTLQLAEQARGRASFTAPGFPTSFDKTQLNFFSYQDAKHRFSFFRL
jgi:hypothetical protein